MSLKHDKTWKVMEDCLKSLGDTSPINISFITRSINTTIVARVKALEHIYTKSSIYSFLLKKGVYPFLLFSIVTSAIGYGAQRTYSRSTKLVLNLLGVIYPSWRCWQLIKVNKKDDNDELKAWLTYWMIFGSFQVLDHWMNLNLFLFSEKKYNLYKLFILYWAQSPHSNGAELLYRHVLQKPPQTEKEEEKHKEETISTGYSYMDGYNPPNLLVSSNSSDDDDSVQSSNLIINTPPVEKETFPLLTESAW